jgi:hypothetical protein
MSTATKVLIGFMVLTLGSALAVGGYVLSVRSSANRMEKNVVYQYEQNKNNYDKMWKTFKETAGVTSMYTEDLEKVYKSAIQGRYGEGGSKAVIQMLKEQNPNFDQSSYKRLQEIIEAGRSDFEENQKMLLDKKKQYVTFLDELPEGAIAGFFGFPKVDLNQFQIVTSDRTEGTFKDKKDDEIKLR